MSDWYCAKEFPIPEGMTVTLRGVNRGNFVESPASYLIQGFEWQPEDPFYEPKPKGEEHE